MVFQLHKWMAPLRSTDQIAFYFLLIYRLAPASFSAKHPLPVQSIVPSYMAMTAAAKRKRKLTRYD